jgi:RND family efflux transporter MFP subunit
MQKPLIALACLIVFPVFAQTFTGLVEPFRDVLLSSAVPGRIARIHAQEGDRIAAGTVLLELESRVEALEVERRQTIHLDETELKAAREREALLKEELASTRALAERTGSVSRDELNRKQLETTLAGLEVARLEQEKLRQAIELEMARERLALQKIAAPFDGVLAQLPLDEGESVQPNQPVLRLVDDDKAFLVINLPAERARALRVGDAVRLRFLLAETVDREGSVAFISPVVDPSSGLRKVKLLFLNANPRIEPGVSGQWLAPEPADG